MKRKSRGVKPGRYRHYKGKNYEVLFVAQHSETLEEYVVYRHLKKPLGYWMRPKKMFLESVTIQGQKVPRFQYIAGTRERNFCENTR